jgi:hypothetical protein
MQRGLYAGPVVDGPLMGHSVEKTKAAFDIAFAPPIDARAPPKVSYWTYEFDRDLGVWHCLPLGLLKGEPDGFA